VIGNAFFSIGNVPRERSLEKIGVRFQFWGISFPGFLQNAFEIRECPGGWANISWRAPAGYDAFQTHGGIKYFIASTRAMVLGISLTASSHVIFVEADWTPAILQQAEARLARIGQEAQGVLAQYLVLENSIDEKILAAGAGENDGDQPNNRRSWTVRLACTKAALWVHDAILAWARNSLVSDPSFKHRVDSADLLI
jgi:helicase-like protein